MAKNKAPVTPAIRSLRQHKVEFSDHLYTYEERGGTAVSARALGVDEYAVIKTLVMEDENRNPLIILMHGNCEVSTKNLARAIGCKQVSPCDPPAAQKHTAYQVGGTSPFGTKDSLPVYAEATIFELDKLYINGGKRGYLIGLTPKDLDKVLKTIKVHVALR